MQNQNSVAKDKQKKREEDQSKKKKKPKKDFEVGRLVVQPSDDVTVNQNAVKPGHWISGTRQMRANNFDFQAEIQSRTLDRSSRPVDIEHTPFRLETWRPASLPKGQVKSFETIYFIPRLSDQSSKTVLLQSSLRARRSGSEVIGGAQPTIRMKQYEYLFVVLSTAPDQYGFLKRLDCIMPPSAGMFDMDTIAHYRVNLPKFRRRVPLPSQPLTWTSAAYILWDDLPPNLLDPDQQQAMLDWLHWGGQLIVSGPNSLGVLRGSFLDAYLPAQMVRTVQLGPDAFAEMSDHWSLPSKKNKAALRGIHVLEENPSVGIQLRKHPDAQFLPNTGQLVVDRQVGRGRIVVTAFNLTDRSIVNWPNFDGIFNACLLRRPGRTFAESSESLTVHVKWTDYGQNRIQDARLNTTLRYFSRDMGHAPIRRSPESFSTLAEYRNYLDSSQNPDDRRHSTLQDDWHFGGYEGELLSGVAGWNDTGGTAQAARQSLKEAAGISIPGADFVFRVLAIYVIVLVPVNWSFFRLIGRVEWAWIVAPIIAIGGAVVVVRLAQLDIGFARSRTEIAVLELYGGHRRAHLTRYTALYTSLSSTYNIAFEDDSALAMPFAVDLDYQRRRDESVSTVSFRRDDGVSLRGFKVSSNSTGIVHCEQMFDLGGHLQLLGQPATGLEVDNQSDLTLRDVGVLYRTDGGKVQLAWIGTLKRQSATAVRLADSPDNQPYWSQWEQSDTMRMQGRAAEGEVNLGRFLELAVGRLRLRKGEVRLIGWTDDQLPGIDIRPRAAQATLRTFVLAHLKPGEFPEIQRDKNTKADFVWDGNRAATDPGFNPFEGQRE